MSPPFIRFGRGGENYKGVLKWARGIIETLRTTVPGGDLLDLDLTDVPKITEIFPEDGTRNIVEDVLDDYFKRGHGFDPPLQYLGELFDWKDVNGEVQKSLEITLVDHYSFWRRGNGGSARGATSGDGFKWAESMVDNIYHQIDAKIEEFLEQVDFVALKKKDPSETQKISQAIAESASDIAEDLKAECATIYEDNDDVDYDDMWELISEQIDSIDDDIMYLISARVREIIPDWKDDSVSTKRPGFAEDRIRDSLITFYDRIFHPFIKGHPMNNLLSIFVGMASISLDDIPPFFFAGRRQVWNDGMFQRGITRCLSEIEDAFIAKVGTTLWDPALRKADILPVVESLYGENEFSKRLTSSILDISMFLPEPFMGTVKYGTARFSESIYNDIGYQLESAYKSSSSERSLQGGEQRLLRRWFDGFEEQLVDAADRFIDDRITPDILALHRSRAKDAHRQRRGLAADDLRSIDRLVGGLLLYIRETLFTGDNASIVIKGVHRNIFSILQVLLVDRIRDACPDWYPPDYDDGDPEDNLYKVDPSVLWKAFREICTVNCKPLKNRQYGALRDEQELWHFISAKYHVTSLMIVVALMTNLCGRAFISFLISFQKSSCNDFTCRYGQQDLIHRVSLKYC